MTDELSRLLSGELSPTEAAALQAQIASDPALAARWAEMQALPAALGALPPELGGAPALRVRPAPSRARWSGWAGLAATAALAATLLWVLRPGPTITQLSGSQLVDGHAVVRAADVQVEVDGLARVTVEPRRDAVRDRGAERAPMDRSHLLASVVGAAVTVTVYEGTARIIPSHAATVDVAAGQTRSVGEPAEAEAVAHGGGGRDGGEAAGAATGAARIAELEAELARLRLENQLASGRLLAHEGKPYDWPAETPAGFRPAEFEARVRAAAGVVPGAEVVAVDCDEYPCIAVLRSATEGKEGMDSLSGVQESMQKDPAFGGEVSVVGMGYANEDEKGDVVRLYGFSLLPGKKEDPDLSTRIQFRADGLLKDTDAAIREGG